MDHGHGWDICNHRDHGNSYKTKKLTRPERTSIDKGRKTSPEWCRRMSWTRTAKNRKWWTILDKDGKMTTRKSKRTFWIVYIYINRTKNMSKSEKDRQLWRMEMDGHKWEDIWGIWSVELEPFHRDLGLSLQALQTRQTLPSGLGGPLLHTVP